MPIKLNKTVVGTPTERLDAFRKTIKDGEGYTADELSQLPVIGGNIGNIQVILWKNKWTVKNWDETLRRNVRLLVNPKTLAQYASGNK